MSEFLGFAWELLAKVVYNVVAVVSSILNLLVFGWVEYFNIFMTYFTTFDLVGKIGAVILFAMLIAVPVLIVAILVHRYRINRRLHRDDTSNKALYREIGRLNKQVLDLMDEKNKLLALKVNAMGGTKQIPYVGASALADDYLPTVGNVVGAATGAGAPASGEGVTAAVVSGSASLALDGAGVKDAAAAMAKATVEAKTLAEEKEIAQANRFPKLSLVDLKYRDWEPPVYDDAVSLEDFVDSFRAFACSQMKLYYTPEIIRRFVAGMAASKLLILEGISGTGKTSLPYSFSRYLDNPATIVSVQPSFRDRTEVLGYFNEFSKRFNETEFLRAVYEAGLRQDPSMIVLDEMNLARVEYYFAEILSVLEMPSHDEWVLDDELLQKMHKLDQYLQTRFKLAFGNRIIKQMYDFIPVYVACGGTELGGMDYIIARKVLKKFESMNVSFVRDEMKGLIEYIEKTFGEGGLPDSVMYLQRIQNFY